MPRFSKQYTSRQTVARFDSQLPAVPTIAAAPDATDMDRWIAMQEELAQSHSEGATLPMTRKATAGY